MATKNSDILITAFNAQSHQERTSLIDEYLNSLSFPTKDCAMTILTSIKRYDPPSGHQNFTAIFLEAYAKKMQSVYYKAQFKPMTPEQFEDITNQYLKAQAELKIYQILQIQKQDKFAEVSLLTEKLLAKYRKTLCQNPELLKWLVKNSRDEILNEIFKSKITQSHYWENKTKARDELEVQIISKYNNHPKFYNKLYERFSEIKDKAQQANVSLRVNAEIHFLKRNFNALLNITQDEGLKHTINNRLKSIDNFNTTHNRAAKKQTAVYETGYAITHLHEMAKKILRHAREQKVDKQTKESTGNNLTRKSTLRKPSW